MSPVACTGPVIQSYIIEPFLLLCHSLDLSVTASQGPAVHTVSVYIAKFSNNTKTVVYPETENKGTEKKQQIQTSK